MKRGFDESLPTECKNTKDDRNRLDAGSIHPLLEWTHSLTMRLGRSPQTGPGSKEVLGGSVKSGEDLQSMNRWGTWGRW